MSQPPSVRETTAELAGRLRSASHDRRVIIGVCGAPGAGKSTLSAALVEELNDGQPGSAVAVPLDGFHLAAQVIAHDERATRRGAPDTFDPAGYVNLLKRIRDDDGVVFAPTFCREIEDPIAAAIPIEPKHRIIVTEGNYLLAVESPWNQVRQYLDQVWFLDIDPQLRRSRLLARHLRFGKDQEQAEQFTFGSDERNAEMVSATRGQADLSIMWVS